MGIPAGRDGSAIHRQAGGSDGFPDDQLHQSPYEAELRAALSAVTRACSVCLEVRGEWQESSEVSGISSSQIRKGDMTPVTVADFAVQAVVSLELKGAGFTDPMVAEEDAAELRKQEGDGAGILNAVVEAARKGASRGSLSATQVLDAIDAGNHRGKAGRYWVLDPIDGTVGFLKGGDCQYTVGLALVEGGEVVVGCMGLPNWTLPVNPPSPGGGLPAQGGGILVYAAKGRGTWVRPLQGSCASGDIRVEVDASSSVKDGGVLCISDHESYESLPMAAALGPDNAPSEVLRMCCGSLCKYAAVAVGAASAYIQHPVRGFPRLKSWDHAAGIVCVAEAGGCVTDLHGDPLAIAGATSFVPGGGGVAVTNSQVHGDLLAAAVGAGIWWRGPPAPPRGRFGARSLELPFLVCIDRDGVINEDVGSPGVTDPNDLCLIPGAAAAIRALNDAGAHVCVVTNQSAVGKGLLTPRGLARIHGKMREALAQEGAAVDGILVACDVAGKPTGRRKPAPGMLLEAMAHFGVKPSNTVFIGDAMTDMQAALAGGITRRILVATGHGGPVGRALAAQGVELPATVLPSAGKVAGIPPEVLPVTVHKDLSSAVGVLLQCGWRPGPGGPQYPYSSGSSDGC